MDFPVEGLAEGQPYLMLKNLVLPRPIAWVTTVDGSGRVNLAPFSFFSVVSPDPPLLGLAIGRRQGAKKDTVLNIEETGEFVVNVLSEDLAQVMNETAADYPKGVSELERAGLTAAPAAMVKPPRVAECPAAMECRLERIMEFGQGGHSHSFIIGEVVQFFVRDDLVSGDLPDSLALQVLGRLGGDLYVPIRETFTMTRPPKPQP